jgi:hypothetical protein
MLRRLQKLVTLNTLPRAPSRRQTSIPSGMGPCAGPFRRRSHQFDVKAMN